MLLSSPPEAPSFAKPRGKKVLVSAGNDWSGDIIEGKEVSDWNGPSLSEVMYFVEYVVAGTRT
jgi:hypothetical protein